MEAYLGEVRLVAFARTPKEWMPCDGRLLKITQYSALFALLSTTYGGNGTTDFALPDLRGRVPIAPSGTHALGTTGGSDTVVLKESQIPAHTHSWLVSTSPATTGGVADAWYAAPTAAPQSNLYAPPGGGKTVMSDQCLKPTGSGEAHDNMQPYLVLQYIICTVGYYPPRP
ncbi:tail Collar domain-containing protein [Azorhizobium oxalatiphilum]|uniref:Tail Collar domain-containing protein n=1 Tax=Azorhizobium oxalatiphilum TaxID=980631 RepID=A0A917C3E4_9HYPH|nr:tail fiber protein [Azorhizobium oxalatiphilum]GGF66141.1 tail Collar domain-containing protein [Azorhizobium oxalatiphilum]